MKDLEYFMALDYTLIIETEKDFDDSKYLVAKYKELDGLEGIGETYEEAISDLELAKENWFQVNLKLGRNIPEPKSKIKHEPTKITLRLPYSLNLQVESYMASEGLSKNSAINLLISNGLAYQDRSKIETVIDKVYSAFSMSLLFIGGQTIKKDAKLIRNYDDLSLDMNSEYTSPSQSSIFRELIEV
ncbi:hypothetical protein BHM04_04825 [Macrococcus sp. IME1552]|nr:type II toxin-antitoxin system HicB family antitoxin [Macrococcus sp. IME1552]ATD30541.1 hypothetical protein BHM04_04825 [Macrococcus sp. IME1552]